MRETYLDKDAKLGERGVRAGTNDASIGDDVLYQVVIDIGADTENLKLVDTMTSGLTVKAIDSMTFYP